MSGLANQRFSLDAAGHTLFGAGTVAQLPTLLAPFAGRRVLLVTDGGLVAAGIAGAVSRLLEDAGLETMIYADVYANPDTTTLTRGADVARAFSPGAVVAIGGGSVLDAAKGMALLATNDAAPADLDYRRGPARPGLPIAAIPTTAGTGSETNGFGVIDDPERKRKFYVGHESVIPRVVILDPDLTRALPPPATAASGIDVLAHALESIAARHPNPYAHGLNLQVSAMVLRYLPIAVADGRNLEARAQMLLAAHMAGLAFATTGLGLAHAAAHALSAQLGTIHGIALGVLLPHVLAFNLPARAEVYRSVATLLDGAAPQRPQPEAVITAARDLACTVGIPARLSDLGATEDALPRIVDDALDDVVLANTPRVPSPEELHAMLTAAL